MLEVDELIVENHGDFVVVYAKRSFGEQMEWREVVKHYGRGSARVRLLDAWRYGKEPEEATEWDPR